MGYTVLLFNGRAVFDVTEYGGIEPRGYICTHDLDRSINVNCRPHYEQFNDNPKPSLIFSSGDIFYRGIVCDNRTIW